MGAEPHYMGTSLAFVVAILLLLHTFTCSRSAAPSSSDANALLKFKESLKDETGALSSWTASQPPCFGGKNNWAGVICSKGGNVWGLRLENMKLSGTIDVETLATLGRLRSFSVTNNNFGGPIPNFSKLKSLKGIYLAKNNFEGSIDSVKWDGLRRLRKLKLGNNKFSGQIPKSLTSLNKLIDLELQGNQFQGPMPDFSGLKSLKTLNISNNQLEGPIPPSIAGKFNPTSFSGNQGLCGAPLNPCPPGTPELPPPTEDQKPASESDQNTSPTSDQNSSSPPPPPSSSSSSSSSSPSSSSSASSEGAPPSDHSKSKSDRPAIPVIALIAGVVIAMVLAILIIVLLLRNRNEKPEDHDSRGINHSSSLQKKGGTTKTYKAADTMDDGGSVRSTASTQSRNTSKGENGKLTFLRDNRERFDLPDLLKAAAEILGSGCFGSSYKATLNNGDAVVVKRFKQMNNVGREEFQEHMRRLGRISHPNLLPLVAYYYRKEEKLFITDPMQKGSLAMLLHGQTRGKPTLDWPTRLKVIKGVARGLAELYKELPCLVAPHGHLKSSNVLLNGACEPVLSDYGLIPLINQESAHEHMVAYKSPEYFNNGRVTKKTDVWALGILIMETLTGKIPASYFQEGNQEVDMSSWVKSVVEEGFDKSMGLTNNSEGEMQKLLNIGMLCCESDVEKRVDIKEACERIDEIKERDNDDDFYSVTEGDLRSSRGLSEDFTVNIN